MIRVTGVNKALWLDHVDCFVEVTVEEGVADVELRDGPPGGACDREDGPYGDWFDDWAESVSVVNAVGLCESASHKSSFVAFDGSIGVFLDFIEPTISDHVAGCRWRDKSPGIVV